MPSAGVEQAPGSRNRSTGVLPSFVTTQNGCEILRIAPMACNGAPLMLSTLNALLGSVGWLSCLGVAILVACRVWAHTIL